MASDEGRAGVGIPAARLEDSGIEIEGDFELSPLAGLTYEDQVFVSAFVRSHGSIKDMEKAFGISYPTVKNRLNRIAEQLRLVTVETPATSANPIRSSISSSDRRKVIPMSEDRSRILNMLAEGKISAEEAERLLDALDSRAAAPGAAASAATPSAIKGDPTPLLTALPKFLYVKVEGDKGERVKVYCA